MKQFITGFDISNTIRMAHRQRRVVFLLVEGTSDLRVLQRFTLKRHVDFLICHGRANALASVEELDRTGELGFLAVVDADFDHLEGRPPPSPNCLFTDQHDLEIDLLCSPALQRVLGERASVEKLNAFEERTGVSTLDALLDRARPLGYLRLVNLRSNHALRFEGLNYSRLLDKDGLNFEPRRLVDTLVQRSQTGVSSADLLSELESAMPDCDPRLLCCGHDVVAILAIGLRSTLGSLQANDASPSALERELRLAFDASSFEQTGLYTRIRRWEQDNPGWPTLAPPQGVG